MPAPRRPTIPKFALHPHAQDIRGPAAFLDWTVAPEGLLDFVAADGTYRAAALSDDGRRASIMTPLVEVIWLIGVGGLVNHLLSP